MLTVGDVLNFKHKLQQEAAKQTGPRTLRAIAVEINTHIYKALMKRPGHTPAWVIHARPYVSAMREISHITDRYYLDSAYEIVLRARCNLQPWRGVDARRIKAELDEILKSCLTDKRV